MSPLAEGLPFRKPRKLRPGDRVAIISPSWGGPAKRLQTNPELRGSDVNAAFADPSIAGIIASIGGDDSVRILPYLSPTLITQNPKLLMGYSDFTTLLSYINSLGNVTVHGPSVMAGIAQAPACGDAYVEHLRSFLFDAPSTTSYRPEARYSEGYPAWGVEATLGTTSPPKENPGWDWAQRGTPRTAYVWGGCIEVLEFMKGTDFWPERSFFDDKFLFFETSEEKPSPLLVERWLRNYGSQTILNRVQGVIFGRPQKYNATEREELKRAVLKVIVEEYGRTDIPIILNFDAGHTDPQSLLPFGISMEIDAERDRIQLVESVF